MRLHKFNFPAQTSEDDTHKKAQKDIVRGAALYRYPTRLDNIILARNLKWSFSCTECNRIGVAALLLNNAPWLAKNCHMTWNIQSQWFIS